MNQKIMIPKPYLAICLSLISFPASAAVIAFDNFNYVNGNLAGNNGGFGWANAWTTVSGGPATVSNGVANINSIPGMQISRTLGSSLGVSQPGDEPSTVWVQFSARQLTTLSGTTNSFGGFGLYSGGTERQLIGKGWPGAYEWVAGVGPSLSSTGIPTLDLTTVLFSITFNSTENDILNIWFNPGDTSSVSSLGPADITRASADLSFDTIRLRGGSSAGGSESWQFDDLILGSALADVVPEPSTALMGSLALLSLLVRRR